MPPPREGDYGGYGAGFDGLLEGDADGGLEGAGYAPVVAGGDILLKPVATIRHVALEPLHPGDQLGILFRQNTANGALHVASFVPITSASPAVAEARAVAALPVDPAGAAVGSNSAPPPSGALEALDIPARARYVPGAAEESDLIRAGDVVLGVSGVCVVGLGAPSLAAVIAAARSVTPGGLVVLHLCDVPVDAALVEEAAAQMAAAAAQLLASRHTVELVQATAAAAVTAAAAAAGVGGGGAGAAGGGAAAQDAGAFPASSSSSAAAPAEAAATMSTD